MSGDFGPEIHNIPWMHMTSVARRFRLCGLFGSSVCLESGLFHSGQTQDVQAGAQKNMNMSGDHLPGDSFAVLFGVVYSGP